MYINLLTWKEYISIRITRILSEFLQRKSNRLTFKSPTA